MADHLKQKGVALFQKGAYEEALDAFTKAQKAYASMQDDENEAEIYNNMGVVYRYMRNWEKAEEAFRNGRDIFAKIGDRHREAQILGNMGDLYEAIRERDRAGGYYLEAIEVLEVIQDIPKLVQTLRVMSGLRLRQFRINESLQYFRRSIMVKEERNVLDRISLAALNRFLPANDPYALPSPAEDEDSAGS